MAHGGPEKRWRPKRQVTCRGDNPHLLRGYIQDI